LRGPCLFAWEEGILAYERGLRERDRVGEGEQSRFQNIGGAPFGFGGAFVGMAQKSGTERANVGVGQKGAPHKVRL